MEWIKLLSPTRFGKKRQTEGKGQLWRSEFEKDYDRIVFSHPFRRLQDKTQVFPLPEDDFVHTRLTHSLEVSSVGKSLGRKAGEIIIKCHPKLLELGYSQYDFGAITAAAALAHDLGNPPFGHAGEEAISDFFKSNPIAAHLQDKMNKKEWSDLCHFEGNAQGFRILAKNANQGLKLTMASLSAFTKYPCESRLQSREKTRKSQKKYGFFQSEKGLFKTMAEEVGLKKVTENGSLAWCRHPLAFLVEAADDICYSIIDLEDGCRLGLVSFEETKDLMVEILGDQYKEEKLNKIGDDNEKISLLRAIAISILVDECIEVFESNQSTILDGEFDKALTDLIPSSKILARISSLSIEKIYRSRIVLETEAAGFEVINGLLEKFIPAAFHFVFDKNSLTAKEKSIVRLLPENLFEINEDNSSEVYALIMNILDLVSGMTDSYAISLYRKINGISLPSGFPTKF